MINRIRAPKMDRIEIRCGFAGLMLCDERRWIEAFGSQSPRFYISFFARGSKRIARDIKEYSHIGRILDWLFNRQFKGILV